MSLDLPTSLGITAFTLIVAGVLLLTSWLQHRDVMALVPWGLAFLMSSIAAALIAARGTIPDTLSIIIANAILSAAYGTMWSGVRIFEGRTPGLLGAAAGTVIWLSACTVEPFYATPTARAVLMAAIGVIYSLLAVTELWRPQDDLFASRWLIIILLLVHTAAIPLRIPLVGSLVGTQSHHTHLLIYVTFESVLISMCGAYLFGNLANEWVALRYKRASLMDPLTGIANRRAFQKQALRLMLRSLSARRSVALLLFDLDHFKTINDVFGHRAGDEVLTAFCRVTMRQLRPTDFFARTGGEEFACLLPDTSQQEAISIAERVRAAFASTSYKRGVERFSATVSIGVAATVDPRCDLAALTAMADRALYRAKEYGRNRVESAKPIGDLVIVPVSSVN